MLKTIGLGSCVSVQRILVEHLANGKIVVQVDDKLVEGRPVAPHASHAAPT